VTLRVANRRDRFSEASLLDGLMCVREHRKSRNGTRAIINLSLAGGAIMDSVSLLVKELIADGVVVTASAGNGRDDFGKLNYDSCRVYPAGYNGVINVAATDMDDNALMGEFEGRNIITNMGSCVDVFAPGYSILSSDICISNSHMSKIPIRHFSEFSNSHWSMIHNFIPKYHLGDPIFCSKQPMHVQQNETVYSVAI